MQSTVTDLCPKISQLNLSDHALVAPLNIQTPFTKSIWILLNLTLNLTLEYSPLS